MSLHVVSARAMQFLTSGLVAVSATIALPTLDAMLSTLPTSPFLSRAVAQDASARVLEAQNAVVRIQAGQSIGSGSIVQANGLIVTNAHVVGKARTVQVKLKDGRTLEADVVARAEACLDLALVQVHASNLPTLALARPDAAQLGQQVFALGYPRDVGLSLNMGIVSRLDATEGMVQTSVQLEPGNSGGPLLNREGAIVGVNTARAGYGLGFAIAGQPLHTFLQAFTAGQLKPIASGSNAITQKISIDQKAEIKGTLAAEDSLVCSDRSYYDTYEFQAKAGDGAIFAMKSRAVKPVLVLLGPDGKRINLDDNRDGSDSAFLIGKLPTTGTYRLVANSRDGGETGTYSLSITPLILWRDEALETGDQILPKAGGYYRNYVFQGRANQPLTITAVSSDFDIRVFLVGPNGKVVAANDDRAPNNTNSLITVNLPQTGKYTVIVNATKGQGRFSLAVR